MEFISILYATLDGNRQHTLRKNEPACFADLNLDKVITSITHDREVYNIKPFFYSPLEYLDDIYYRQGIIQDVGNENLYSAIKEFSSDMQKIREISGKKECRYYHYQQKRWELECILLYCQSVTKFREHLSSLLLRSSGMTNFRNYLSGYIDSENFKSLSAMASRIKDNLEGFRYNLIIKGDTINVEHHADEINYSDKIISVFSKFKQRDVTVKLDFKSHDTVMTNVEARILECVARLFPSVFSELDTFIETRSDYQSHTLNIFEREIQFYLASIEYFRNFQNAGLSFCIPEINVNNKNITVTNGFDLALAYSLLKKKENVVCNDFQLRERERILVVSGPNQGGKTTFARMIGQLHYLALLGLYVPAEDANLFLVDNIFTHFEKSENIHDFRGKLYDDLVRIKSILDVATSKSLIIMNEIFTSTTSHDALYLGTQIIKKIVMLDALCVCVTFIDELTRLDRAIVSMMSTVENDERASRTYRIARKPSDGVAWSATLVQKYGLTYEKIKGELNG